MISVYVHGTKSILDLLNPQAISTGGWLDIPDDAKLSLEALSEPFQMEEKMGELIIPFQIEWTDNNRKLLNYSERVENFNKTDNFWICTLYEFGFPVIEYGKITILGKKGNFNYQTGTTSISISGTKGIFASAIRNKKLKDLELGGTIPVNNITYASYRDYAYQHYTMNYASAPQIRFAPVAIEKFYNQDRTDFSGEFLAKDTVNCIVEDGSGSWVFGRPSPDNPEVAVTDKGQDSWVNYATVPFLTAIHVVRSIFNESGFNVIGEFLDGSDFSNLVIFNNFMLERYTHNILGYSDNVHDIDPKNHVPDMLVEDFIRAIFSMGIFPVFTDSNNVILNFHSKLISDANVGEIDSISTDLFESTFSSGSSRQDGYKISYTSDKEDSFFSERVKELTGKIVAARVNTFDDLATVPAGGLTTDHIVYVRADNMYYQVADATATPVLWDAWAEGLNEYVKDGGERQIDLGFDTLATYVILNEDTGLMENQRICGTRQHGTYFSSKGDIIRHPFGLRLFYCNTPGDAAVKPVSYNHNLKPDNTQRETFSLALSSEKSIAEVQAVWQDAMQNAEIVKVYLFPDDKSIELLKKNPKVFKGGILYLIRKIEREIPLTGYIETELIPL